jgi:toxoflavin synthase
MARYWRGAGLSAGIEALSFAPVLTASQRYGVTILHQEPEEDRYACEAEFLTDPPFRVRRYQWNQATYEWELQEAGFRAFTWHPSEVAPEDVARYGETYWPNYDDNCPTTGLICQK